MTNLEILPVRDIGDVRPDVRDRWRNLLTNSGEA